MATKHTMLTRLRGLPEDSRLWDAIAQVVDEYEEMLGLQWLKEPRQARIYAGSEAEERLEELENKFGEYTVR